MNICGKSGHLDYFLPAGLDGWAWTFGAGLAGWAWTFGAGFWFAIDFHLPFRFIWNKSKWCYRRLICCMELFAYNENKSDKAPLFI